MIDAIKKCENNSGFVVATVESFRPNWLGKIKSEMQLWSKGVETKWAMTGCTVIAGTWADENSRALINFLVSSPSGTFFHKSVDASLYYKSVKYLSELFDSVIQDFGAENVANQPTHKGHSNWIRAAELLNDVVEGGEGVGTAEKRVEGLHNLMVGNCHAQQRH
ncbi:hAT transposon superfamily [Striga asiatica]|uniref:HAT transposon superfamily n=1 Tax=Striga asiatica TaxID=4170 RepID=A0A5A7R3I0_STRAF|nr:hAT transposon superfamily [Striga asiatica]